MSNYYITEAFKQLNLLESEDIAMDASGVEELRSFLDDAAVDPDEEIEIYDLEAEAKEDLKKSYEGKVVLECTVCHSHVFEDKENISVGEDGEVCMDLECPYCMSNEGYYIIGEIAPYNPDKAEELQADEEDLPDVDIEDAADEVDDEDIIEESCNTKKLKEAWEEEFESEYDYIVNNDSLSKKEKDAALSKLFSEYGMNESMKLDGVEELYDNDEIRGVEELEGVDELEGVEELHGDKHEEPINEGCDKELKEDIEDVSVTTEDETMTMTTKEDGGVVIETMPKEDDEEETVETEDEMIVPIEDETSETIDVASDALDSEDEIDFDEVKDEVTSDEELSDEEFADELEDEESVDDFEEFDEESFDNLGESYLKNCYENVTSFKTSNVSANNNKLFIEGLITFDSGNKKKTNFVFEAVKKENGKYKFEGYNQQISRGKKTFKLNGIANNNKLVCESLNYNYRSKNDLNESVRVYGTVRKK